MDLGKNESFQDTQEPDLREQISVYLRHWYWFALAVVVCLAGAYLYLRYSTPLFKSTTSIVIKDSKGRGAESEMAAFADIGLLSDLNANSIENEIQLLRSKRLIRFVVEKLELNIRYFTEGNIKTTEFYSAKPFTLKILELKEGASIPGYPITFTILSETSARISDPITGLLKEVNFGDRIDLPFAVITLVPDIERIAATEKPREILIQISNVESMVASFQNRLQVNPIDRNASVIELSINDPVKEKAQDFLNELVNQYNRDGIDDRNLVANNTASFIDERLTIISAELDSVETDKVVFKQENRLTDIESEAQLFLQNASEFNKLQVSYQTQLVLITDLMNYLSANDEMGLLPANLGLAEGGMESLINNYNGLILQRNRLLRSSTEQNPVVVNLTNQINDLKQSILSGLQNVKNSIEANLRDLRRQESIFGSKIAEVPGQEKEFRGIDRQQSIKEALYLFLLQKREEASISLAVTAPKAKVVDAAYSSNSPVAPKHNIIYLAALIIGLLIPFIIIYLHQLLYDKVSNRKQVERLSGYLPFLGEIPKLGNKDEQTVQINDRSVLAESFRILRTNLNYLFVNQTQQEGGKTIFVTSTVKGEGKTFIAVNLALTLAYTGKKVLLVGGDIRNPRIHYYLEQDQEKIGLTNFLVGDTTDLDPMIKHTKESGNLNVLFSGPIPPNPAELWMSHKTEKMFELLKTEYDYVIVDTAPCLLVTDTFLISNYADATLYVVRADYTERKLLDFPKENVNLGKLKNTSIVLNNVKLANFGYGNKYGYTYGAERRTLFTKLKNVFG